MCNRFRSLVGQEWKPGDALPLELAGGVPTEGVWAGFATREKFRWWLRQPGNHLARGTAVSAVAERASDSRELVWGPVPPGARLIFVLGPVLPAKSYRLAKMLTTAANANQLAYFRHDRFPVLGDLEPDGRIREFPALKYPPPPAPIPDPQGSLF